MNRDQLEGRWNEFNARVKQAWGDLTDDEPTSCINHSPLSSEKPVVTEFRGQLVHAAGVHCL